MKRENTYNKQTTMVFFSKAMRLYLHKQVAKTTHLGILYCFLRNWVASESLLWHNFLNRVFKSWRWWKWERNISPQITWLGPHMNKIRKFRWARPTFRRKMGLALRAHNGIMMGTKVGLVLKILCKFQMDQLQDQEPRRSRKQCKDWCNPLGMMGWS